MERSRGGVSKASSLRPDYPQAHYNLGNAYLAQQRTADAIREYQETLRLKPDFPGVHMNLGAVEESQGHLPEAIAEYRAELRLHPSNADGPRQPGERVRGQPAVQRGGGEYRKAIELEPQDRQIHMAFANSLLQSGDVAAATAEYQQVLEPDSR